MVSIEKPQNKIFLERNPVFKAILKAFRLLKVQGEN